MSGAITATGRVRLVQQLAEPARGWIVHAPQRWSSFDRPWTDLAQRGLQLGCLPPTPPPAAFDRASSRQGRRQGKLEEPLDGLLYVPPVAIAHRAARDALVAKLAAMGTAIGVQLVPGESPPPAARAVMLDLTGLLLAGEIARLAELPSGAHVLWPLLPGISDGQACIEEGCRRLLAAGARVVQPVAVAMRPAVRKHLAAGRASEVADALFHRPPAGERRFAHIAGSQGLAVWATRPESGSSPRIRSNRRIAAALALAAELWGRLERPAVAGQALWRAALQAETSSYDLAALGRENNLSVLDWLDARAVDVVRDVMEAREPALVRTLRAAYVGAS